MAVADVEIARAALAGGWPQDKVATAVAVALAESGGEPTATNKNDNGTTDYGLWQINSIHKADLDSGNWQNPTDNARMAYNVFRRAGNSFSPWYAYRSGKHYAYMSRGALAANEAKAGGGSSPDDGNNPLIPDFIEGPAEGTAEVFDKVSHALGVITDEDTWIRTGFGILGAVIIVAAVAILIVSMNKQQLLAVVTGGKAGRR